MTNLHPGYPPGCRPLKRASTSPWRLARPRPLRRFETRSRERGASEPWGPSAVPGHGPGDRVCSEPAWPLFRSWRPFFAHTLSIQIRNRNVGSRLCDRQSACDPPHVVQTIALSEWSEFLVRGRATQQLVTPQENRGGRRGRARRTGEGVCRLLPLDQNRAPPACRGSHYLRVSNRRVPGCIGPIAH